jgi:hypothetical protein
MPHAAIWIVSTENCREVDRRLGGIGLGTRPRIQEIVPPIHLIKGLKVSKFFAAVGNGREKAGRYRMFFT